MHQKKHGGDKKKSVIAFDSFKYKHYIESVWYESKNAVGCTLRAENKTFISWIAESRLFGSSFQSTQGYFGSVFFSGLIITCTTFLEWSQHWWRL